MLKLAKISYTTGKGVTRRVNILSTSEDDALRFLRSIEKNGISTINDLGMDSDVHAYTDAAVNHLKTRIEKIYGNQKTTETKDASIPEIKRTYICPWCEKEFEKTTGLKIHIKKAHKDE